MKMRFLLLTAIAVLTFNGFAQKWESIRHSTPITNHTQRTTNEETFVFGYSTDDIEISLGSGAGATLRVGILLPKTAAAKLAGSEITKIHLGFGKSPATNTRVFIIEDFNTTPAYTQSANFATSAWNTVNLTTPYSIDGTKDVLIGYEFTSGSGTNFYSIGLDGDSEAYRNGNYFSVKDQNGNYPSTWENFVDYGYYNATIKATIQDDNLPQYDLSVTSVKTSALDVFPNESFFITTKVENLAVQTITDFKLVYKIGNITSDTIVSEVSIAPFKNYTVTSKDLPFSDAGVYEVEVSAELIENIDEDDSNNTLSTDRIWVGNSAPTISRNRNVVLEEYTGIYCVYCPDGHKRANQLQLDNPGQVAIINIHQGSYASPSAGAPDFRTSWGNALAGQTGLTGYPSGTINRHVFSGSATALGRDKWAPAAEIILNQASPVNLLAGTHVDWATRTLTVDVSGYYTANSNTNTNLLNVALLQENILGPQIGAINFYPEMLTDEGLYKHNHMLRHLLTGQWGETITQTTAGSSFSKQYTYTIPEHINNVPIDLNNLTVVGFIAEGHQEIITGTTSKLQNTYIPTANIRVVSLEQSIHQTSDDQVLVKAIVENISTVTANSYSLSYSVNGGDPEVYEVTGKNLQLLEKDTLLLPPFSINLGEENTVNVSVAQTNEVSPVVASQLSLKVTKDLSFANSRSLVLKLWQDRYGNETTWALFGPDQEIVLSGGPYNDLGSSATKLQNENLNVSQDGVYRFEIYDAYGDGINSGAGTGKYEIWAGTTLVTSSNGQFGSKEVKLISVTSGVSIKDISASDLRVYNHDDNLHLISPDPIACVTVYDMLGKQVISRNHISNYLSLKELEKGIYVVKVLTKTGVEKIVKIKR
jgi:hypothetical protein